MGRFLAACTCGKRDIAASSCVSMLSTLFYAPATQHMTEPFPKLSALSAPVPATNQWSRPVRRVDSVLALTETLMVIIMSHATVIQSMYRPLIPMAWDERIIHRLVWWSLWNSTRYRPSPEDGERYKYKNPASLTHTTSIRLSSAPKTTTLVSSQRVNRCREEKLTHRRFWCLWWCLLSYGIQ